MDAPNEEFCAFIIDLYTDYRKGGPTKQLSMLDLLDKLDTEYNHINNLGSRVKRHNPQLLDLTSSITTLHFQLSTLTTKYISLQALVAQSSLSGDHNNNNKT